MTPAMVIVGFLSTYTPRYTPGELACGGRYNWTQHHIAIRDWRGRCGAIVKVCIYEPRTSGHTATVWQLRIQERHQRGETRLLAGSRYPGVFDDHAILRAVGIRRPHHWPAGFRTETLPAASRCIWTEVRDSGPWGAYRRRCKGGVLERQIQVRLKPGWHRRSDVDLSWALWVALGRPPFRTRVRVEVYR